MFCKMCIITLGFSSHKSTHWVVMYFSIMVNEHLLQIFLLSLFFQVFCVWVLMKRRRNYDEYRKKSSTSFSFVAVELYQHIYNKNLFYQNNNVPFLSVHFYTCFIYLLLKGKNIGAKTRKVLIKCLNNWWFNGSIYEDKHSKMYFTKRLFKSNLSYIFKSKHTE